MKPPQDPAVVVAVGETGLDYYRSAGGFRMATRSVPKTYRECREMIGKTAHRAYPTEQTNDTVSVMREEGASDAGGVMHCFYRRLADCEISTRYGLLCIDIWHCDL